MTFKPATPPRMTIMKHAPQSTISVIVPAYNVEPYIDEAIASLLAQRLPFHQIIVIDDGSTDATLARLQAYASAGKIKLHSITNSGLGAARNCGAALADGDYLYFFDADDVADPMLCASVTAAVRAIPDTDLVFFAGAAFLDDPAQPAALEVLCRPQQGGYPTGMAAAAALQRANCFHASACLYVSRRHLWNAGLQFEAVLHEDAELIVRLCSAAGTTQVLPHILFRRRQRAGSIMAMHTTPRHMLGHLAALTTASRVRAALGGAHDAFLVSWMSYLTWRYLKNCEQLHLSPSWHLLISLYHPRGTSVCRLVLSALVPVNLATLVRIGKHSLGARLRGQRQRRQAGAPQPGVPPLPSDHQRL
jgi:glycosyltransferase involved in cell wall biosynthesis